MTLRVGTSGWAYKEWKPDFYPADLPQRRFLEHYSARLSACEINATFYRLQSDDTMKRWAAETPDSFRFALKAHRSLTHGKTIDPSANMEFLEAFFARAAILGVRLGAVLFQFPAYRHRDDDALDRLLGAVTARVPCAFEFRSPTWDHPDIVRVVADAGATVCVSNTDGTVPDALPPGPLGYVRLRTDRYSSQARAAWQELLGKEAARRDVFAFAKHEGIPAGDPFGGIGLACWLAYPG